MLRHERPHVFHGLRCGEAFEEEFQVGVGLDLIGLGGFYQGKEHGTGARALGCTGKKPVLPAQDTLIALTTFQMIAHAHGLGTVWDGLFMMALSLCPDLAARLGIPEQHLVGYAMAFGRPAVEYHRNVQRAPAQVNVVR